MTDIYDGPERRKSSEKRLEEAQERKEKADHRLRVYTAWVVTVVAVLIVAGYAVDFVNRQLLRHTIVECVSPGTPCNNEIREANQAESDKQFKELTDLINKNTSKLVNGNHEAILRNREIGVENQAILQEILDRVGG